MAQLGYLIITIDITPRAVSHSVQKSIAATKVAAVKLSFGANFSIDNHPFGYDFITNTHFNKINPTAQFLIESNQCIQ